MAVRNTGRLNYMNYVHDQINRKFVHRTETFTVIQTAVVRRQTPPFEKTTSKLDR
jgi:hypothetical protein